MVRYDMYVCKNETLNALHALMKRHAHTHTCSFAQLSISLCFHLQTCCSNRQNIDLKNIIICSPAATSTVLGSDNRENLSVLPCRAVGLNAM